MVSERLKTLFGKVKKGPAEDIAKFAAKEAVGSIPVVGQIIKDAIDEFSEDEKEELIKELKELSESQFNEISEKVGVSVEYLKDIQKFTLHSFKELQADHEEIKELIRGLTGRKLLDKLPGCKLLDKQLIPPASKEEILEFYSGDKSLAWKTIAANGDIRRDQEKEIVQASQESGGFRIICIVAEPGAGKTTLASRVSYQLLQEGEFVIHLLDNRSDSFWYSISNLTPPIARRFYILIDDIFRYDGFVDALRNILQSADIDTLPVTIIATCRFNEYHEDGFRRFVKKIELKLSADEKNHFLRRLGKPYEYLPSDVQYTFNETDAFLVLGMVVTEGKGFDEIVSDIIEKLKEGDKEYNGKLFQAYKYVCFSYCYDISIPEDLLLNLDKKFYEILGNERAKGVFYEESLPQYPTRFIRAKHQLVAEKSLDIYRKKYSEYPKILFEEIFEAADEENWMHRRYIAYLTRAVLREGQKLTTKDIKDIVTKSEKITPILHYASVSELSVWKSIFGLLNLQEEAEKCVDEILSRVPNTTLDCQLLLSELLKREFKDRAFYTIKEWLEEHSEDRIIFTRYLSLVKDKGSQEQIEKVIVKTRLWLKDHPDDNTVRVYYLSLVKEKGNQEQIEEEIEETTKWLKDHPDDSTVRSNAWLVLIRDKGNQEQIENVIEETSLWLKDHPDDNKVRAGYLSLVKEKGNQEQIEEEIERATKWLKDHPDDNKVHAGYLSLVKEKGNKEKIEEAIEETTKWLKGHPDDNMVREAWLVLIRDKGNQEQIRRGIGDTISWLKVHPEDNKIRSVYLSLVRDKGFFHEEDIKSALDDTEQWMKKHGTHPLFQDYLSLVEKVIKTGIDVDIDIELVKQFGYEFINSCKRKGNPRLIRGFADWLRREKCFDDAEQIYENLLKRKMGKGERSKTYFSYGKLFFSSAMNLEFTNADRIGKLKRAEEKFREALKTHKGHHMAYVFLYITLKEEGRENEAENELELAKWWFPINVKKKELFLFSSLPPNYNFKNSLNNGIIPKEIKNDFKIRGNPLSRSATIKMKAHNRWEITDKSSAYPYYIVMIDEIKRGKTKEYKLNTYGNFHPGRLLYKIGNVYLEFNRYKDAIDRLKKAIEEEPEDFTNWWKLGHAKMKLAFIKEERGFHKEAKDLFVEALSELETAWEKADKPLQLPASREIPAQIEECKRHLSILDI